MSTHFHKLWFVAATGEGFLFNAGHPFFPGADMSTIPEKDLGENSAHCDELQLVEFAEFCCKV
jgi:hypothetical protein